MQLNNVRYINIQLQMPISNASTIFFYNLIRFFCLSFSMFGISGLVAVWRTPLLYAENESYAINATVFDLDPKLYTKHFKKYVEKTKESYHAVGQYSSLWFYIITEMITLHACDFFSVFLFFVSLVLFSQYTANVFFLNEIFRIFLQPNKNQLHSNKIKPL